MILKRRESRASKYLMDGCLKKLRGKSAKRVEPPEPLRPPPGVDVPAGKPKLFTALVVPETLAVKRAPEKALKIGENVQPFRSARPTLLSFKLAKLVL